MTASLAERLRGIHAFLVDILGGEAGAPVPARVWTAIAGHQKASETATAWAQLAGALLFLILYAATPTAFSVSSGIEPAPIALALYTAFVALRLWLVRHDALGPGLLAFGIVADVGLLYGLIALLPLALDQPLALALKHSAYAYAFVLIALRALRFEPIWVLFTGLTATGGWLLLTLASVWAGGPDVITLDAARYFSAAKVLPAAEVDRIGALLAVTIVLWLAVRRGRALVIRAYTSAAATSELSRFFIPELAERLATNDMSAIAGAAEMRHAAILFFDMRGFSRLSLTLAPADMIALLGDYHRLLAPILRQHNGSIDKFLGDGILVSFGAVSPNPQYAADALRGCIAACAAAVEWRQARMAAGQPAPAIGAGLASGPILFGTIGLEDRLEYTVLGDCVNLAAKLEKQTKVEAVAALTTADTYALAQAQGFVGALDIRADRPVDGMPGRFDLVALA